MTGPALLGAVRDAYRGPGQVAAREALHVYADWLEEQGDWLGRYWRDRLHEGALVELHRFGDSPNDWVRLVLRRRGESYGTGYLVGECAP